MPPKKNKHTHFDIILTHSSTNRTKRIQHHSSRYHFNMLISITCETSPAPNSALHPSYQYADQQLTEQSLHPAQNDRKLSNIAVANEAKKNSHQFISMSSQYANQQLVEP